MKEMSFEQVPVFHLLLLHATWFANREVRFSDVANKVR